MRILPRDFVHAKSYRQDILYILDSLPIPLRQLEGAPRDLLCDSSIHTNSGYRTEHRISWGENKVNGLGMGGKHQQVYKEMSYDGSPDADDRNSPAYYERSPIEYCCGVEFSAGHWSCTEFVTFQSTQFVDLKLESTKREWRLSHEMRGELNDTP